MTDQTRSGTMVPLQLSYSEGNAFGLNFCRSQLLYLLTDDRLTATFRL